MISLQTLPVLILWVVVIVRVIGLRYGWKPGILPAVAAVALSATLNIDQVYLAVDGLLGGWNFLNLIVHLLMGVGMTVLSVLLLQATGRANRNKRLLIVVGFVLAMVQMVLLAVSHTEGSATNFTDVFGAIPTVALYQVSFFAWVGIVVGYTGVECLRRDSQGESRSFSIGFDIVGFGCLAGLAAVTVKMILIWIEVANMDPDHKSALYVAYRVMVALTIVCFAIGFMLPSYARIQSAVRAHKTRLEALETLKPIVERLMDTPEGKRSMGAANITAGKSTSKTQLYRWFIFIGDIQVLDCGLLSPEETEIIDEIGKKIEHNGSPIQRTTAGV